MKPYPHIEVLYAASSNTHKPSEAEIERNRDYVIERMLATGRAVFICEVVRKPKGKGNDSTAVSQLR